MASSGSNSCPTLGNHLICVIEKPDPHGCLCRKLFSESNHFTLNLVECLQWSGINNLSGHHQNSVLLLLPTSARHSKLIPVQAYLIYRFILNVMKKASAKRTSRSTEQPYRPLVAGTSKSFKGRTSSPEQQKASQEIDTDCSPSAFKCSLDVLGLCLGVKILT